MNREQERLDRRDDEAADYETRINQAAKIKRGGQAFNILYNDGGYEDTVEGQALQKIH